MLEETIYLSDEVGAVMEKTTLLTIGLVVSKCGSYQDHGTHWPGGSFLCISDCCNGEILWKVPLLLLAIVGYHQLSFWMAASLLDCPNLLARSTATELVFVHQQ